MNNHHRDHEYNYCNMHPTKVIIGICSLCLKERLLMILAASELSPKHGYHTSVKGALRSHTVLQKVSALSNSFLHRLNSGRQRNFEFTDSATPSSQEDSFISIKFEDGGYGSWEKGKEHNRKPYSSEDHLNMSFKSIHDHNKFMINKLKKDRSTGSASTASASSRVMIKQNSAALEHTNPAGGGIHRWGKRIGQLFQLVRLRKSSMGGNGCHVGGNKVEGVKIRKGWIKSSLTKRKKVRGHETKGGGACGGAVIYNYEDYRI